MFDLMAATFMWLPTPLYLIVSACFSLFSIIILVEIIKVVFTLFQLLSAVLGGLLGKVVRFFV